MKPGLQESINLALFKVEGKVKLTPTGILLSLILVSLAAFFAQPLFKPVVHGILFSILSKNPFVFNEPNYMQARMLGPVIGFYTLLRGDLFVIVPWLFSILTPAIIYIIYRSRSWPPFRAICMAMIYCFSGTLFIPFISPGYTDSISFFFVFLSFAFAGKPVLSAIFFCLALLNHEANLCLLPGLFLFSLYAQNKNGKHAKFFQTGIALSLAILPLFLMRLWVESRSPIIYSTDFYFNSQNIAGNWARVKPWILPGAFFAFQLLWIFPVLLLMKRKAPLLLKISLLVVLAGTFSQLLVAYDITRLIVFGFPAIIFSAEWLFENSGSPKFSAFAFILIFINLVLPHYFGAWNGLNPIDSVLFSWPFFG